MSNTRVMPGLFSLRGIQMRCHVAGSGSAVTLLHPVGLDHTYWAPYIRALARSYTVVAPDLRGHSASELGSISGVTVDHLALDVLALWDRLGIETSAVVGVSVGGMVAQGLAIQEPLRVPSLVLVSTSSHSAGPAAAALARRATMTLADPDGAIAATLERWFESTLRPQDYDLVEQMRATLKRQSPRVVAEYWTAIGRLDYRDSLRRVDVATCIIVGAKDASTPPSAAKELIACLKRGSLIVIPDGGHMVAFQQPARVLDHVRRHLEAHPWSS